MGRTKLAKPEFSGIKLALHLTLTQALDILSADANRQTSIKLRYEADFRGRFLTCRAELVYSTHTIHMLRHALQAMRSRHTPSSSVLSLCYVVSCGTVCP